MNLGALSDDQVIQARAAVLGIETLYDNLVSVGAITDGEDIGLDHLALALEVEELARAIRSATADVTALQIAGDLVASRRPDGQIGYFPAASVQVSV